MSKIFRYYKQSSPSYYSAQTDETFSSQEEFEYRVERNELRNALCEILSDIYFTNIVKREKTKEDKKQTTIEIKESLNSMIADFELEDNLSEQYEEELKDYFEQDAMLAWSE